MQVAIRTLGCKSNRYESDRLFELLNGKHEVFELNEGAASFADRFADRRPDVLVVNTCTVTNSADRKSRQSIRSYKNLNSDCKVVVFGCGANVSPEDYEEMDEVDFVAHNTDEVFGIVEKIGEELGDFEACEYEAARAGLAEQGFRTRALVKIQDGCNSYCTYCIIPTARGPELSFSSASILKEVCEKEAAGFSEIVLTGINIGEWKEDGMDLSDLFELLILNTKSVRFRVSSIEPRNFSGKFFELFKTGRFCPHIHMSLQSGSDSILKRMRRNYDCSMFFEVCENFRAAVPDIALTTDIIVGFPGETEQEFEDTCAFAKKAGFSKVHVFPYSKRARTAASHMRDHVPEDIKKVRAKKLRKLSERLEHEFRERWLGKEYDVVIEKITDGFSSGYTENYIPVQINSSKLIENEVRTVRLESLADNGCVHSVLVD